MFMNDDNWVTQLSFPHNFMFHILVSQFTVSIYCYDILQAFV